MYVYVCILFYVATSQIARPFVECFEKGTPNFLSVPPCEIVLYMKHCVYIVHTYVGDIFKTVISIYAQGDNYKLLPLPSLEEVLICDHNTTVEEVNFF